MKFTSATFQTVRNVYLARHDPEKVRVLADFYWRALLMFAIIGIIGSVAYGSAVFFGVLENLNAPFTSAAPTPGATLDRAKLDQTLNAFAAREAAFNAALSGTVSIGDPSR